MSLRSQLARSLLPWLATSGLACAPPLDPIERGRALVASKALSPSTLNVYTCLDCHAENADDSSGRILPGAPLAGATERASFWGGQENDLLSAINACRSVFMLSPSPLTPQDPDADALYSYLLSLEPGITERVPFTVVRDIENLPRGSAERGLELYQAACGACHGAIAKGTGRGLGTAPILPQNTIADHPGYSNRLIRLVFIEKVRHGPFLGYGGDMPPFSLEILSDADLSDILEALGVTGEN